MNLEEFAQKLESQPMPETPQTLLVYGGPKTGKTSLVATLAKKYNLIWLDCEKGYQTLFSAVPREYWKNIQLIPIVDSVDSPRAIKTLTKVFRTTTAIKICEEHGDVACILCSKLGKPSFTFDPSKLNSSTVIVVDSLTQTSDSAMAHALGFSGEMQFKKKEYTHWDNQGLLLKTLLLSQQRMPCHVVFISHEEVLEHEDGTKKITPVGGSRNFSPTIARYFDHIVYTSIRNGKHCINSSTKGDVRVQAGSRNQIDVKSVDDFINIFEINYQQQGKKAALTFAGEADVVEEIKLASVKSAVSGN
jgi:cytidylate kinase